METLAKNSLPPTMTPDGKHASGLKSDGLILYKYSDSQSLYQLPEISDDTKFGNAPSLWDQVTRFVAYLYAKHIRAPSHTAWCRDPARLLPGATRMILFDNDGWLLTRLSPYPTPHGNLILAATSIAEIYTQWRRRHVALSAYHVLAAGQEKSPSGRVRVAPGDHLVSVFEDQDQDLFVVMEMDSDGEIMFYHECLHCQDFACKSCIEVLDNVVAFGQRHTQVDRHVPMK
ncbi:hypothetical protein KVR01_012921 [Diaporthe batatas]|uniref:uncharacterized protein n=1 Tax=Diaporthe batatas TaxID=748121 RepID=UPI001D055618|nr:uncharacterized protein KVR01_012921 [Diaporthe batatas]KAG8157213.1 hypothetical protein KVR01_012921 [Diaporthe batatas]